MFYYKYKIHSWWLVVVSVPIVVLWNVSVTCARWCIDRWLGDDCMYYISLSPPHKNKQSVVLSGGLCPSICFPKSCFLIRGHSFVLLLSLCRINLCVFYCAKCRVWVFICAQKNIVWWHIVAAPLEAGSLWIKLAVQCNAEERFVAGYYGKHVGWSILPTSLIHLFTRTASARRCHCRVCSSFCAVPSPRASSLPWADKWASHTYEQITNFFFPLIGLG